MSDPVAPVPALSGTDPGPAPGTRRGTVALSIHSLANGLIAYAFFAAVTRTLGPVAAAPVSVLWTLWSFSAAAITFPIQHWVTRSITAYAGEGQVRAGLPKVAGVAAAGAVVAGLASWALAGRLFHGSDGFPVLVALVCLGSVFLGSVRGALGARGRFSSLGWSLTVENSVRLIATLVLAVVGVRDPFVFGLALVAGFLSGLIWVSSLRFSRGVARPPVGSPAAFLATTSAAQLFGQTVLVGTPVLVSLLGGAPIEVTALFATLALFRAPYVLALGVMPTVTASMTRAVVDGAAGVVRRLVLRTAAGTVVLAVVGWVVADAIGPDVVRLVFGEGSQMSGAVTGTVAAATVFSLGNLVFTSVLMAHNRPSSSLVSWAVAYLIGALAALVLGAGPQTRAVETFLVIELAAFGVLLGWVSRAQQPRGTSPSAAP